MSSSLPATASDEDRLVALADIEGRPGALSQRVYDVLRAAIFDLVFPPGAVLRKGAICERLGVSRSPVTEAFTLLQTEGLVEVVPQSGTRVTRLSMDELQEQAFLRDAIEVAAAARVAMTRTDAQLTELTRNLRLQHLLQEDGDDIGFYQADEAMHALILGFTGYRSVPDITRAVAVQLKRARMMLLPEAGRIAETLDEHDRIVDAIRAQDAEAASAAMRHHLAQLLTRLAPLEAAHPEYFRPAAPSRRTV